jgi:hypothetical protein
MVLFLGLIWQIYESNQSSWGSYNDAVNGLHKIRTLEQTPLDKHAIL